MKTVKIIPKLMDMHYADLAYVLHGSVFNHQWIM